MDLRQKTHELYGAVRRCMGERGTLSDFDGSNYTNIFLGETRQQVRGKGKLFDFFQPGRKVVRKMTNPSRLHARTKSALLSRPEVKSHVRASCGVSSSGRLTPKTFVERRFSSSHSLFDCCVRARRPWSPGIASLPLLLCTRLIWIPFLTSFATFFMCLNTTINRYDPPIVPTRNHHHHQ